MRCNKKPREIIKIKTEKTQNRNRNRNRMENNEVQNVRHESEANQTLLNESVDCLSVRLSLCVCGSVCVWEGGGKKRTSGQETATKWMNVATSVKWLLVVL